MAQKASVGQLAELGNMVAQGVYDADFVQALIEKRVIVKPESPYRGDLAGVNSDTPGFRAEVIYTQPKYADLKKAFDWLSDGYKSVSFKPIEVCKDVSTETREIEFELVHLDKEMHTDAILAELDRRGFRPALYEEILAFAAKYTDEQRKYPIVALGSVCQDDGDLDSPYVFEVDVGRYLNMYWIDNPYPSNRNYRFLAVRK